MRKGAHANMPELSWQIISGMKLSQKMVLIVALPLVFELCIFSTIWAVMNAAEKQAQTAESASVLVNKTNAVTNEIYAAGGSLAAFIATKSKKFDARFLEFVASAELNIKEMESIPLSQSQKTIVAEEKQHVTEMLAFLTSMREKAADSSSHRHILSMHNQHKKAQAAAQTYLDSMQHVLGLFEADAKVQRNELAKSKALVGKVLATGMILSLLLALTISLGFAQHVTRQMKLLREKAHKLVTFEDLGQPSFGNDEIAELDRTFHDVAALLAQNAEKERQLEEMKRNLVTMVSHDLRAPLTSTRAFLNYLNEGRYGAISGQGKLTLRSLHSSLGHVSSLIDDMLSFSAQDWQKKVNERFAVDIGAVIKEAIDVVSASAQLKSITIALPEFPDRLVNADETRIVQALSNIISNSIKYCPSGSTIRLSTAIENDMCKISIEDDGPGMGCEAPFAPFVRGSNASGTTGRGLGLFLTRQVIENHGGTIELDGSCDSGTKFDITLPLCDSDWNELNEAKAS